MSVDIKKDRHPESSRGIMQSDRHPERSRGISSSQGDLSTSLEVTESPLDGLYEDWFLTYASYVILDRAIPSVEDGLKPVQRRLLHAMKELDDGRYNKAANIIGHTMRYHPHGDMAIGEALVKIGQKELLIDTQGNWGNTSTGDRAAAPRYIEARLTKFAKDVLFSPEMTTWRPSYDGRNEEPELFPVKFPLLLFLGTEGIAVGLSTKILPHNFCEIIKETIAVLRGFTPNLLPDFFSGGIADFTNYLDGKRGGRVLVRGRIEIVNPRTLKISELPFGSTTPQLIDSILDASEKGKVKLKKIEDNTAEQVEIIIHLQPGSSPEQTIAELYQHTDCQMQLAPSACVIKDGKPVFCSISEILDWNAARLKSILEGELKTWIKQKHSEIFKLELERIFIDQKLYRILENSESFDDALQKIHGKFKKFDKEITGAPSKEDIERLTEIKIRRIASYDLEETKQKILKLRQSLIELEENLAHSNNYTIAYLESLLRTYGESFPRRTVISSLEHQVQTAPSAIPIKLMVDEGAGFIGTDLKEITLNIAIPVGFDILFFMRDGSYCVPTLKPDAQGKLPKQFIGEGIVFWFLIKDQDRIFFQLLYSIKNDELQTIYAKNLELSQIAKGRKQKILKDNMTLIYSFLGEESCKHRIKIHFKKRTSLIPEMVFDFSRVPLSTKNTQGVKVTQSQIEKIEVLGGTSKFQSSTKRIWFDRQSKRLNEEASGLYLGQLSSDDNLVFFYKSGTYEISKPDLQKTFFGEPLEIAKWSASLTVSVIYYDETRSSTFAKTVNVEKKEGIVEFIDLSCQSEVFFVTTQNHSAVCIEWEDLTKAEFVFDDSTVTKTLKALGAKIKTLKPLRVQIIPKKG